LADNNIQNVNNGQSVNGAVQGIEKPWFLVAILPSGTIVRENTESAAVFHTQLDSVSIGWVDYVTGNDFNKEALETALQLGFSHELVSQLTEEPRNTYLDNETELGMKLPSVQVRDLDVDASPFLVLIKKCFIFTIHSHNVDRRFSRLRRYSETILKKIPAGTADVDRLATLLARIIDHNNDRNFEHLRQIEEQGDRLNAIMLDPYTPRAKIGPEIYRMKHALLTYLDALWNTVDVLHTIRYGDAELITDDPRLLDKLSMLGEDVNRQISLAEHMSDVLSSGLEVMQTIYNNQLQNLNNRLALLMTYLTIIGTAVLVPNTLATILGNAAFLMEPNDIGWYLTLIIGSTVLATGLVYWWVKKRGWIPKKMD
jgi:magnesium transporter